jgi:hypothetical protein
MIGNINISMGICDINIRGDHDPETSESGIDQGAASPVAEWATGFGITQGKWHRPDFVRFNLTLESHN